MKKIWLVSVSMGYGHQRTAFNLKELARSWINANDYPGIPLVDRAIWERAKRFYDTISNLKKIKFFGEFLFSIFNFFQRIEPFYPKKNSEKPNFYLRQIYSLIEKGWGMNLIQNLKMINPSLPFVTTFFIPAFFAEYFRYPGEVYCVICDTDIARHWAPLFPSKTKIKYFAPTQRVVDRLKSYGVPSKNIFLVGYPLPLSLAKRAHEDIKFRLLNLDPKRKFLKKYKTLVESKLKKLPKISSKPLTILFSIGGSGAQKEIALEIFFKLKEEIKKGQINYIISVGTNEKIKRFFERELERFPNLSLLFAPTIFEYFEKFDLALSKTDILWTKPSELSFYSALGIPILCSPPIGAQEEYNLRWLLNSGYGILQKDLKYLKEWLFDWLEEGYFAEMAFEGFLEGERFGVKKIEKIISEAKQ